MPLLIGIVVGGCLMLLIRMALDLLGWALKLAGSFLQLLYLVAVKLPWELMVWWVAKLEDNDG